ncbi:MAG: sulfatase [Candidatus Hydrogenedentota bacterium]
MNAETPDTKSRGTLTHFVTLQVIAGVLLYFCDFLLGSRINSWMGFGAEAWMATLPGILLYGIAVTIIAAPLTLLIRRLVTKKLDTRLLTSFATFDAMVILALLLHELPLIRLMQFVLPYGFSAAGAVALIGVLGCINRSIVWTVLSALIGTLGGLGLLQVLALTLFAFDNGHSITHTYVAGWASIIALIGACFYATGNRSFVQKSMGIIGLAIVSFALPGVVIFMAPSGETSPDPDRKNIVLITADTMRADFTSAYGGPVPTPNLDRLAARGTRINQYYSVAPWTVPSFAGFFSSKYPPSITLNTPNDKRMEELSYYRDMQTYWEGEEGESLVQNLSESGYTTYALVGNFALYGHNWLLGDFDHQKLMPMLLNEWKGPLAKLPMLGASIRKFAPEKYELRPFDYTRAITEYAQAFIRFRTEGNFFLWAHYFDPHTPYDPPQEYRRVAEEPFDFFPMGATPEMLEKHDYVQSLYEGEIRYVDESVGRILYTLKLQGLEDNTYVMFSSDHGEEFWDHGGFGHGHTVFNEQLRVPFMIAGPDIATGVIAHPVSSIDIIPTLAELTGEEAYAEWRGTSIADLLRGHDTKPAHRPVFAQATGLLPPSPEPLQTVIDWPFKLIRGMESDTYLLYNLKNDPGEKHNLAKQNLAQQQKLAKMLAHWSSSFPMTFKELKEAGQDIEMDEETLENLKGLGYLE